MRNIDREIRKHNMAQDDNEKACLNWEDIADNFKACRKWELVATAAGITVEDLEKRFLATCPIRPLQCAGLADWGKMLVAQADIDYLKAISKVADEGGRQAPALLAEGRQTQFEAVDYLPTCCPAPNIFRGGWSVLECEKILGELHCPEGLNAEICRDKCMLAEKIMIRITQTNKARDGHAGMAQYLGDVVLHQGTGGQEAFAPAAFVFEESKDSGK